MDPVQGTQLIANPTELILIGGDPLPTSAQGWLIWRQHLGQHVF